MQFGFMKGKGTTDAIFMARQLQENFRVKGKKLFGAFLQATSRVPRWWIGERPPDMAASCDIYK